MGRYKRKSPYPGKRKSVPVGKAASPEAAHVSASEVAELAVDIWKVERRAIADGASQRVLAACERAMDRLKRIGIELDTLTDRPYNHNLRMRVVEHEETDEPRHVTECLSPGVLFKGNLVREGEVVTRGK